jgi:flagellar hook-basal body complex protein FliE
MKVIRWFTFALALSLPSTLLADEMKDEEKEITETEPEERAKETTEAEDRDTARVKSHLIPVVAGIEAADKGVAALYELAGGEEIDRKDAQAAVRLADEGLEMAFTRVQSLNKMKNLSEDAKSEADNAMTKLKDARTALNRIEKQVNKKQAISRNQVEQLREDAKDLHSVLSDAENSVEQVAKAYDVSTDLELEG